LIASFCLFLFPGLASAAVDIPTDCRIANRPPGLCGWCALETLARHHGIEALHGLTEKSRGPARPSELEQALITHQVRYSIQQRGPQSTRILQEAIRADLGALVGFRPLAEGASGHIVTLVDFGPEEVRFIDPDAPRRLRVMDLETFLELWDGFALVLQRPESSSWTPSLPRAGKIKEVERHSIAGTNENPPALLDRAIAFQPKHADIVRIIPARFECWRREGAAGAAERG
jgi:hypothetical protein